ncbi:unnamed protein product [Phytomonas sp. EM1]|nr:unnamed protein product [Phytomonas sp. EM1]|eukprot:CCW61379.1 unnamed protein product [Phytomonas sp. isolate EM1]
MAAFFEWRGFSIMASDCLKLARQVTFAVGLIFFSIAFAVFVVVYAPFVSYFLNALTSHFLNRRAPVTLILFNDETLSVLNLSNMVFTAVFILLIVTFVILDRLLIETKELLRQKSKAPSQDVINYYNTIDPENAMRIIRRSKNQRKPQF